MISPNFHVVLQNSAFYSKEIKGRQEKKKKKSEGQGSREEGKEGMEGGETEKEKEANLQSAVLSLTFQNW